MSLAVIKTQIKVSHFYLLTFQLAHRKYTVFEIPPVISIFLLWH